MIDPDGEAKEKEEKEKIASTSIVATKAGLVPRIAASSEKSIVAEVTAGLVSGMVGRRLRPDDEHEAITLIRAIRPSIGFTYVPAVGGIGVDVETIMPQVASSFARFVSSYHHIISLLFIGWCCTSVINIW
jgi:hypothetical protein